MNEGITEKVMKISMKISQNEKEFYLPHRSVIRESAKITKIIIAYDASTKPNKDSIFEKKSEKRSSATKFSVENHVLDWACFAEVLKRPSYKLEYEKVKEIC